MAKRRTKEQISADKIIKKRLLEFGAKVLDISVPFSRRDTGRLQDEQNYRVKKDTVLEFAQMQYGAYNYPDGDSTKRIYVDGKLQVTDGMNALLITINNNLEEATDIIIKDITSNLIKDFTN